MMPDEQKNKDAVLRLADCWQQYRERLARLLDARMPAALQRRMGRDDMMQEVYLACGRRLDALCRTGDTPIYVRLRRIALQTLVDMERRHLAAGKRDVMREMNPVSTSVDPTACGGGPAQFADSVSGPRTHLERMERRARTRRVLNLLSDTDREILELRHFEELSNAECAAVLGITQKTASIRYVRALGRLKDLLLNHTDTCP